jgi:hypothetical protein
VTPRLELTAAVPDTPDPRGPARFHARLFRPQDDVRVCLDPAGHPFCLWVRD